MKQCLTNPWGGNNMKKILFTTIVLALAAIVPHPAMAQVSISATRHRQVAIKEGFHDKTQGGL
jgi:hypothetical protein